MALIYRAIWDEDRSNLISAGENATKRWFKKKGINIGPIADGVFEGRATHPYFKNEYGFRAIIAHAEADGITAFQLRLFEDSDEAGHRITSQYTVLVENSAGGTHWVDVERVAVDPFTRFDFRIPSLVNDLIRNGTDPRVGQVRLEQGPKVIEVGGLVGLIKNRDRKLPLVVFSHDRAGASATMGRAKLAHERLRGVAQVFVLPAKDVDAFRESVGEDLSVWGGGARLYLPNWGPAGLRPERHRYVSGAIASRWPGAAAEIFAQMLAATVPATLEPPAYTTVRGSLRSAEFDAAIDTYVEMASSDIAELKQTIQELRNSVNKYDDQLFEALGENEFLNGEVNRLSGQLSRVQKEFWTFRGGAVTDDVLNVPDSVSTISEALLLAHDLQNIEIHDLAPVDIEDLESSVESGAWAELIWRGFRALDSYVSSREPGKSGFWEWCKQGQSAWTWPASTKKIAMTESETVLNDPRLRAKRLFPVSEQLNSTGRIEMLAHLKIAEGGGPMAPRVYFYDDSDGATGRIHIGYVGPHKYVPNAGTN